MSEINKTKELQRIIQDRITAAGVTAYADEMPRNPENAPIYPYAVYSIGSTNFEDVKDNIILDIDLWDLYPNYERIEELADKLESVIPGLVHIPSAVIIPEFFRYLRNKIPDTNKNLKRINLKFEAQVYPHEKEV